MKKVSSIVLFSLLFSGCFNSPLEAKKHKGDVKGVQIAQGTYGILIDTSTDGEPDLIVSGFNSKHGDTIELKYFDGSYYLKHGKTTSLIEVYKNPDFIRKGVVTEIKKEIPERGTCCLKGVYEFLADVSGDGKADVRYKSEEYYRHKLKAEIKDTVYLLNKISREEGVLEFYVKK